MEHMDNPEEYLEKFDKEHILGTEIRKAAIDSEIAGGAWVEKLTVGKTLEVQTKHTKYKIERRPDGLYISGHPKYCPKPTLATIRGSTFGGSSIKMGFVGVGCYLEFAINGQTRVTSEIVDVKED